MVNFTGMGVPFKEQEEAPIKETQSLHGWSKVPTQQRSKCTTGPKKGAHILEVRGALVGEVHSDGKSIG